MKKDKIVKVKFELTNDGLNASVKNKVFFKISGLSKRQAETFFERFDENIIKDLVKYV